MAKNKKAAKKIGGPFLAAAFVCESFLQDNSGKISALGIADGCNFFIPDDAPPGVPSKSQPVLMSLNILILFRSGDSPGKHDLKLVVHPPDGKRGTALDKELIFSDPPHGGIQLKTGAHLSIYTGGVYWIDVILDGKRYTRIPYNVNFQRLPKPESAQKKKSR